MYLEHLIKKALDSIKYGLIINGEVINILRYADGTVLVVHTAEELQRIINYITTACIRYVIKTNCKKMQTLILKKNDVGNLATANKSVLIMTETVTYLGFTLNKDCDHSREISCRNENARATFNKMPKILCNPSLNGVINLVKLIPKFLAQLKHY